MKLSAEKRAELTQAHALTEEAFVSLGDRDYVIRKPTSEQFGRFAAEGADPKKAMNACRSLANDCVLWPAAADLARAFDERPAHVAKLAQYAAKLAGTDDEIVVGKAGSF